MNHSMSYKTEGMDLKTGHFAGNRVLQVAHVQEAVNRSFSPLYLMVIITL